MKLDTIKKYLNGYFINRITHNGEKVSESLCKKIDNKSFETLGNVKTPNGTISSYNNLLNQINNQILDPSVSICSLDEVLPVIDGTIFENYEMREKKIQKYINWCQCVETEENELSKGRYLVKWKKPKKIIYAIVMDDTLTPVPANLIDDTFKEKAVSIRFPKLLERALKDDLNNQYAEAYAEEVEKYQSI